MTTFDLTRTAIEGGVVIVRETQSSTGRIRTYSAKLTKIEGKNVPPLQPYKIGRDGQRVPRKTVKHWTLEFEEI